ncbi:MAG: glycosyltransferase [Flavobacteriales bacterium]|nr:glycosyltransferase [Flavobacteriales bacterium]
MATGGSLPQGAAMGVERPAVASLISVIVPCYNMEPWAERCIGSLLAQHYANMEIIAVNDCSTDGTGALLDRLALKDDRVKPLHLPANGGLHAARQAGFNVARGDLIGFVDADDHVGPDMYASLAGALQRTGADMALCGHRGIRGDGTVQRHHDYGKEEVLEDRLLERFAQGEFGSGVIWSKLYRRHIIQPGMELALDRRLDSGADYIVGVGCFTAARSVVTVAGTPYLYALRTDSMSMSMQTARAFVFLLDCYAACLEVYAHGPEAVLRQVDALYRRQLRFNGYRVGQAEELLPHREYLAQVLARFGQVRPQALYGLVHTFDPREVPPVPAGVRFHLGQVRRSLAKAVHALFHGKA